MLLFVFFFKQKTAYEMRISDWSSDVCSSDLFHRVGALVTTLVLLALVIFLLRQRAALWRRAGLAVFAALVLQVTLGISIVHFQLPLLLAAAHNLGAETLLGTKIGRASCRERGCQYV